MKQKIYIPISALISIGMLVVIFREVSLKDIIQLILEVDPKLLVTFLAFSLLMNICRTWRYKLLLESAGEYVKALPLFLTVLVRNCCADLLPAKIGSTVYLWITVSRLGIKIESALSSFFISFIFDLLALIPLLLVLILLLGSAGNLFFLSILAIVLLIFCLPVLLYLPFFLNRISHLLNSNQKFHRLAELIDKVARAVNQTKSAGNYGRLFLISVFIRLGKYLAMYAFLLALIKPLNFSISAEQIPKAFTGLFSAEVAASLPVSGIAGFGAYEGAWLSTFSLLGFPREVALQTGFAHHLATQAYGYGLGLLALIILMLPIFKTKPENTRSQLSFSFSAILISLCLLALSYPLFASSDEKAQKTETAQVSYKIEDLPKDLSDYQLYFDSNRSGNFGIYRLNLRTQTLETISDTSAQEIYPDLSKDGKLLVFARAWSLARNAPASIYLLNLQTGEEHLISENGTFPSFTADRQAIIFERNRKEIIRYDLQKKSTEKLFPFKKFEFEVVKPRMNQQQNKLAFISDKGGRWSVWTADLQSRTAERQTSGCEPFWQGEDLIWIKESRAQNGSGVYLLKNKAEQVLQENQGEFGHEYFPVLSTDEKYLSYSAAPNNQHSHLEANYQIFVKNLQNGNVTRINFDKFTNRWGRLVNIK